ncbi:uncharacterized protein LOC110450587 isoform X2 [Mizuhopecten yessoensis]|uniref:uncharacterized protein LOC110450587 isoform X2 n=1 Tax=Mizuhopecten yessoensis TaxID=6573 RepID=UPI000B45D99B|nr:uncharacterized protein LOC110450587 isoform X2 [Mizuhopecten yessoensis]
MCTLDLVLDSCYRIYTRSVPETSRGHWAEYRRASNSWCRRGSSYDKLTSYKGTSDKVKMKKWFVVKEDTFKYREGDTSTCWKTTQTTDVLGHFATGSWRQKSIHGNCEGNIKLTERCKKTFLR